MAILTLITAGTFPKPSEPEKEGHHLYERIESVSLFCFYGIDEELAYDL